MTKVDDWHTDVEIQWCPGCPNFGILQAFKLAMVELGKQPHELCVVSGIGQAAKFPHYVKANFFNGLHGRALPAALAIHAANPDLTTIVMTGEGDCYGEGGNHFIHTLRRNPNLTLVVHNNGHYALTKGQASPDHCHRPNTGHSSAWCRKRSSADSGHRHRPGLQLCSPRLRRRHRPPEITSGGGGQTRGVLLHRCHPTLHHLGEASLELVSGAH